MKLLFHSKIVVVTTGAILLVFAAGCGTGSHIVQQEEEQTSLPSSVLFVDRFTDRELPGWTQLSGAWRSGDGVLAQKKANVSKLEEGFQLITVSDLPVSDYRIEADLRFLDTGKREGFAGIVFRFQDEFNFYQFRFCDFEKYQDRVEIYELCKGQRHIYQDSTHLKINPMQWYHVLIEVMGPKIQVYLDGIEVVNLTNPDLETGTVGLATKNAAVEFQRFLISRMDPSES